MIDISPTDSLPAVPLLLSAFVGIAGIVVWHAIPSRLANARLIAQIPFFLAMSGAMLAWRIVPYAPPNGAATASVAMLIGFVKLLWWLHLAWSLIGFVRIYLVVERRPREARLLRDVVVGVVYAGMLLAIMAFVFAVPVATLIATSGAIAIVFGLALQNTLSDVFSGIALNLGRPYVLGDWIQLSDGVEGRVIETNWRSTHLLTFTNNVVVLPNSFLAKLGITNVSYPDETHGLSITVRFAPTRTPAAVAEIMRTALGSSNLIVKMPPPLVAVRSVDAIAIELSLIFRIGEVGKRVAARNEIHDLAHRHARSAGLILAPPSSALVSLADLPSRETARQGPPGPLELIQTATIFASLDGEAARALAATSRLRSFRSGEIIVQAGEALPGVMILRSGVVARQADDAETQDAGLFAPGDVLGEAGALFGCVETATLRAVSPVEAYEIDAATLATLLRTSAVLADGFAARIAERPHASVPVALAKADQPTRRSAALLDGLRLFLGATPPGA